MSETVVQIEAVTRATEDVREGLQRLLPTLSRSAGELTPGHFEEIVTAPCTTLLIARGKGGAIIGSLTLVLFRIPSGLRAWIEDVVVDESARGQGVGEQLTREAVRRALDAGARTVDLTSRASRTAAHHLYEKVGFAVRETQVYRYTPTKSLD